MAIASAMFPPTTALTAAVVRRGRPPPPSPFDGLAGPQIAAAPYAPLGPEAGHAPSHGPPDHQQER